MAIAKIAIDWDDSLFGETNFVAINIFRTGNYTQKDSRLGLCRIGTTTTRNTQPMKHRRFEMHPYRRGADGDVVKSDL